MLRFLRSCGFALPLLAAIWAASVVTRVHLPDDVPIRWVAVPDLPSELAIMPTVFWEPLDTVSLRRLLRENPDLVRGKSVLEIGTGSGLLALCCRDAERIVATDINPQAIECARLNARRLGMPIEFRLVPSNPGADSGAFSVIKPGERFDLIISNPPWEDGKPRNWSEYALYDSDFQLLRSILEGCRSRLKPGGRVILAYGCVSAIRVAQRICSELGMVAVVLDDRDLESLPEVFLPGMLLGITPGPSS